jgi:GNAT superfamily N-acetyltransferase
MYSRKVNEDYYQWQFFQTPFPSQLLFACAAQDEVIGCYGCHVVPALCGTLDDPKRLNIAWTLDMMVTPDWQGKGVFKQSASAAQEWAEQHAPAALCVMANPRGQAALIHGLAWRPIAVFNDYVCSTKAARATSDEITLVPVDKFGDEIDRLNGAGQLMRTNRSADFLNWRFLRNRQYRYTAFSVRSGSNNIGYVSTKVFVDPISGQSFGDIVDLQWGSDFADALPTILQLTLSYFRTLGVDDASTWLQTNTALDRAGRSVGFVETQRQRFFACKVLDPCYDWLHQSDRWFISMGDAEIY